MCTTIDHGVPNLFFQSQIVLILTLIHLINYSFVLTNQMDDAHYIILYLSAFIHFKYYLYNNTYA